MMVYKPSKLDVKSTPKERIRFLTNVEYAGTTRSVKEWSRLTAISPKLVCCRMNRGWPLLKAITTLPKPRKQHYISYAGLTMTIADWSKETGKGQRAISKALKQGKTIEEALGLVTRTDEKELQIITVSVVAIR